MTEVTVGGRPLDEKKRYTLATTSFLAIDGGDGYSLFKGAPLLIKPEQGPKARTFWLKPSALCRDLAAVDGRIRRADQPAGGDAKPCDPRRKHRSSFMFSDDMATDPKREAMDLFQRAYEAQQNNDYPRRSNSTTIDSGLSHPRSAHFSCWYSFQDRYDDAINECLEAIRVDDTLGNPYNDMVLI